VPSTPGTSAPASGSTDLPANTTPPVSAQDGRSRDNLRSRERETR